MLAIAYVIVFVFVFVFVFNWITFPNLLMYERIVVAEQTMSKAQRLQAERDIYIL